MTRSSIVLSARKEISRKHVQTAALGHAWSSGTVTTAPTCSATGVRTYTCSRCDAKRTESIPMTAHTPETVPGKAATCFAPGLTEGSKCSVCGTVLKEQEEIPTKGHTLSEAKKEIERAATCTEAGSYDEVVYCSVCEKEISRKHVQTAALGHAWSSGTVTTAPTCSATGVRTYTCSRCDAKRTESIPMTAHTPETVPGKAATCFAPGLTEGSKCSVCGEVLKEQQTIVALSAYVCRKCGVLRLRGDRYVEAREGVGKHGRRARSLRRHVAYVGCHYGIAYADERRRALAVPEGLLRLRHAAERRPTPLTWRAGWRSRPPSMRRGTTTVSADHRAGLQDGSPTWSGYNGCSHRSRAILWAPDIIYNPATGEVVRLLLS